MNIQKQIEQLEQTIYKAKSELEELKQQTSKPKQIFERGEVGDDYWLVGAELCLSKSLEANHPVDGMRHSCANYYLEKDKSIAERVAKYYQDNNWFIRKAIEFADGYEWVYGENNCYVYGYHAQYCIARHEVSKRQTTIYMAEENAEQFKAWLEECAPIGEK